MKALSLKQPFAELVVSGRKSIELRKWKTHFRGKFLIHASKQEDATAMKKFGFALGSLSCGAIVGEVELVDVKFYNSVESHRLDSEKHLADLSWGTYGFVLKNAKRLREIPCKGKLNFWEFHS